MRRYAGIQAVTFDVGNTLIRPWKSVGHIFAEVAAAHGHGNCSPEELNRRFASAFRNHGVNVNTKPQWAQIVDATFAGLLSEPSSRSFFPNLYERFTRADAWRIFGDVDPTLAPSGSAG